MSIEQLLTQSKWSNPELNLSYKFHNRTLSINGRWIGTTVQTGAEGDVYRLQSEGFQFTLKIDGHRVIIQDGKTSFELFRQEFN